MEARTKIINSLIKTRGYKDYLEIGVSRGTNFRRVKCDKKVGVDPAMRLPLGVHGVIENVTSDEFFLKNEDFFDIIFIDGDHTADQVYVDIAFSLEYLKKDGIILVHDVYPKRYESQVVPRIEHYKMGQEYGWTGDVWKSWVTLINGGYKWDRNSRYFTIDVESGIGIIEPLRDAIITNRRVEEEDLTYENFEKNAEDWLKLVSLEQAKKILKIE